MTTGARELPGTLDVASTLLHLFDVPDDLRGFVEFRRAHEHQRVLVQRQPRPVVRSVPPAPRDQSFALQVALLADRVSQGRTEMPRIDDGVIDLTRRHRG